MATSWTYDDDDDMMNDDEMMNDTFLFFPQLYVVYVFFAGYQVCVVYVD